MFSQNLQIDFEILLEIFKKLSLVSLILATLSSSRAVAMAVWWVRLPGLSELSLV